MKTYRFAIVLAAALVAALLAIGLTGTAAGSGYWYGIGRPYQVYLPLVLKSASW